VNAAGTPLLAACLLTIIGAATLFVPQSAHAAADDWSWVSDEEGYQLTLQHCFNCHGVVFTGARAPNILTDRWNHMETLDDMPRIIRDGIPSAGMPAFGEILTETQITAIADFISLLVNESAQSTVMALSRLEEGAYQTQLHHFMIEPVVDGLRTPWSFAFLPDGRMIIAERGGALRLAQDGRLSGPVAGTPAVWERQDGGLFALALDPDYQTNGWIYLSFADPGETFPTSMTKIVRGRLRDLAWVDEETVWAVSQDWYGESNMHYGTRLLFNGGFLYFPVGDRGDRSTPQDLASPLGKIHRVLPDGGIPPDNPFADDPGHCASVWTYGHRNPQGLAISPEGELWSSEHGPSGGDELNLILRGHNYGWPLATAGTEYSGAAISEFRSRPGMDDPLLYWGPQMAPSAIAFYRADPFPKWKDQLLVGSLASQELRRVVLENGQAVEEEVLFNGLGRIRDIQTGPDGLIYVALERHGDQGGIVRLRPQ
jgi:glucose/arabinose dehydrogenase